MNKTIKRELKAKMAKYDNTEWERFVDEYGWADWMNDYTMADDDEECTAEEIDRINEMMREVWMEVQDENEGLDYKVKLVRQRSGLSQADFGAFYGIPTRTIEDWESGVRKPTAYLLDLLLRAVHEDRDDFISRKDKSHGSVVESYLAHKEAAVVVWGNFLTFSDLAEAFNEAEDPDEPYTAEDMKAELKGGYLEVCRDGAVMAAL